MDQAPLRPALAPRRLVNGYQVTQAIHVAAVLGIADLLADGPRTSDDLAATESHPGALYRQLRARRRRRLPRNRLPLLANEEGQLERTLIVGERRGPALG
jgi:hypothetical protein